MKWIVIGGSIAALASSAGAQVTCSSYGLATRCDQSGVNMPMSDPSLAGPLPGEFALQNAQTREIEAKAAEMGARAALMGRQLNAARLQDRVGSLVAGGKCDDAVKLALRGGNFDLAERAKALCVK